MFKWSPVALACVSALSFVQAKETTDLEHISVYASRSAVSVGKVNASVTVLTRADIELYQPKDLPALLALIPGVQLSREGGRGQTASVFIRGSRTKHSLVLIDGVRTGSATLGYQELSQLPVELIESVEVIRGPRAALYGSDAVAGVIAVTTRKQDGLRSVLRTGSHGLAESAVHGRTDIDQTQLSGSVGYARADGFHVLDNPKADQDRDGFQNRFLRAAVRQQFTDGELALSSQFVRGYNEYDYNPSWGGADEAKAEQDLHQLSGRWQQQLGGVSVSHQGHLAYGHDDSLNYGNNSAPSSFITNRRELDYQLTAGLSGQTRVLAGVNRRDEDVEKTGTAFVRDSRLIQSVFTGISQDIEALALEAVLRHDHTSAYGHSNTYQWGASYQLTPQLQVRLNQGSAFKVPTFNDLYWPGSANPGLKPEESRSREAGLRFDLGGVYRLQFDAVHFDRNLTNMIAWNSSAFKSENIAAANLHGLEYSLSAQTGPVEHQLSATYTEGEDLQSKARVLPNIPRQKYTYVAALALNDWQLMAQAQYRDRVADKVSRLQELSSVTLFGAGASYQFSPLLKLQLNLDNLFDKDYQTARGYKQGGREFSLSVQSSWF